MKGTWNLPRTIPKELNNSILFRSRIITKLYITPLSLKCSNRWQQNPQRSSGISTGHVSLCRRKLFFRTIKEPLDEALRDSYRFGYLHIMPPRNKIQYQLYHLNSSVNKVIVSSIYKWVIETLQQ